MLRVEYNINESKINTLLDETNRDRDLLFSDIKTSKTTDKQKEIKIKGLENIQRALLSYKNILTKEQEKKEKY